MEEFGFNQNGQQHVTVDTRKPSPQLAARQTNKIRHITTSIHSQSCAIVWHYVPRLWSPNWRYVPRAKGCGGCRCVSSALGGTSIGPWRPQPCHGLRGHQSSNVHLSCCI